MNTKNEKRKIKKAVALKYNYKTDNAPKIIASGQRKMAQKIVETAKDFNIPIKKNQDIVDVLAKFDIGDEIPEELYSIIAEFLSFIYKLEDKAINP